MRLTPLEWGLRAPITPRLGGEPLGATAPWQNRSQPKKNKPTLNTKLRILPLRATALFPQHHEDVSFGLQRAQKASLRPTFAVR